MTTKCSFLNRSSLSTPPKAKEHCKRKDRKILRAGGYGRVLCNTIWHGHHNHEHMLAVATRTKSALKKWHERGWWNDSRVKATGWFCRGPGFSSNACMMTNPSFRRLNGPFWPLRALQAHGAQKYMQEKHPDTTGGELVRMKRVSRCQKGIREGLND